MTAKSRVGHGKGTALSSVAGPGAGEHAGSQFSRGLRSSALLSRMQSQETKTEASMLTGWGISSTWMDVQPGNYGLIVQKCLCPILKEKTAGTLGDQSMFQSVFLLHLLSKDRK